MKKIIYLLLMITIPVFGQDELLNFKGTNAKNYYEEVTFEYIGDKIIVPVEIEGKTYRFLFDTGAPCMISKEIYELIQSKILKQTEIEDTNQINKNINFTSLKKLKFGSVVFENLPVIIYDFNSVLALKCFNLDGVIGGNLFANSIFQIDLSQKKIRFTDNIEKLHLNQKKSSDIKLKEPQKSPYINIGLAGRKKDEEGNIMGITEDVLLDTGANGFYSLSKRIYNLFHKNHDICNIIAESTGASSVGMNGIPSRKKHLKTHINAIKINDLIVENVITKTDNDEYSKIGTDILKYGIVTLDYKNKKFYFNPISEIVNRMESDFGLTPINEGNKLIVNFVWDDELKKKISYGDEIIEINGAKAPTICDLILNSPFKNQNKMKLKIKTKKGEIVDLNLEKKFPEIKRTPTEQKK